MGRVGGSERVSEREKSQPRSKLSSPSSVLLLLGACVLAVFPVAVSLLFVRVITTDCKCQGSKCHKRLSREGSLAGPSSPVLS